MAPEGTRRKRKKHKKKKIQMRVLCLKTCWLKTPEDWQRFDTWAEKNAQPRKPPPEPEPIKRLSKPLSRLKKRIRKLATPKKEPTVTSNCLNRRINKAALKHKPSKRLKKLAKPKERDESSSGCRSWCVKRTALNYEPSENIIKLSKPMKKFETNDCKEFGISRAALFYKTRKVDEKLAIPKWINAKDEDTCKKKRKKKKKYIEFSDWMEYLALPSFRIIKDQNTEKAKKFKDIILKDVTTRERSTRAYEEQVKKRAERKRREIEERKKNKSDKGLVKKQEETEDEDDDDEDERPRKVFERPVFPEDPSKRAERRKKKEAWRYATNTTCKEFPPKIRKSAKEYEASEDVKRMAEPKKYNKIICKNFYKIKKAIPISDDVKTKIDVWATPKYPVEPVPRTPPRNHDKYGRPILPKPSYGKKMPPRKPFVSKLKCPPKDDTVG